VLVPILIITGISVVDHAIKHAPDLTPDAYYSAAGHLYVTSFSFTIIYGLAIGHRKDSATHARYMIGTMFPAFSPIFFRILGNTAPGTAPLFPTIGGLPATQLFAYGLADIILITLIVLDWQKEKNVAGLSNRADHFDLLSHIGLRSLSLPVLARLCGLGMSLNLS
jgi:hypothetical protein